MEAFIVFLVLTIWTICGFRVHKIMINDKLGLDIGYGSTKLTWRIIVLYLSLGFVAWFILGIEIFCRLSTWFFNERVPAICEGFVNWAKNERWKNQ